MLTVTHLSLSVGGETILRDIGLEVRRGEFVAIVGPNGAGKSSLLKCVDRIHTRYRGDVLLDSVSTRRMSQRELARRVAYVPQLADGMAGFTVRQFAEQGRYPWKRSFEAESAEDLRIVEESLRLAGVDGLAERLLDSLSGGERQKVLVAAALAQDTPLLLLDEPTTYLDYRHQAGMLELIRLVHARGRTILAVTHDLNFAMQSADRLVVLSEGAVAWSGEPGALNEPGLLERLFGTEFLRFEGGAVADGRAVPWIVPAAFASPASARAHEKGESS